MASIDTAPSLAVSRPAGPAVTHLLIQVPPRRGAAVLAALRTLPVSFGLPAMGTCFVSVGMSFEGLVALGLPERYQRVFLRLAPAFHEGAPLRSRRLGDGGPNAVANWCDAFRQDRAHVLVSWHGSEQDARLGVDAFRKTLSDSQCPAGIAEFNGMRLQPPGNAVGDWVHFGYRDGISELVIDGMSKAAPDPRDHATGELLLGYPNDSGSNRFALTRLRDKPRRFFQGGSFGVFRPMAQDIVAFEKEVGRWQKQLAPVGPEFKVSRAFVKAKLGGRWPDGRTIVPGTFEPTGNEFHLAKALAGDRNGLGCPFGAHVRRMRSPDRGDGLVIPRPLQRRGVPFGPADWSESPKPDGVPRGLLGHFFCASIETQFEHLLGQWAARAPLDFPPDDCARDPLIGPHEDPVAALRVPIDRRPVQHLGGMQHWTTTLGTLYAWYPEQAAWQAVLDQDYVPIEDEEPWL